MPVALTVVVLDCERVRVWLHDEVTLKESEADAVFMNEYVRDNDSVADTRCEMLEEAVVLMVAVAEWDGDTEEVSEALGEAVALQVTVPLTVALLLAEELQEILMDVVVLLVTDVEGLIVSLRLVLHVILLLIVAVTVDELDTL